MSKTFADLGISFPLFEAPIEEASQYYGITRCSLCGNPGRHCFELDIGDEVVVHCERCETQNSLDAVDATSAPCRECGALVHFPAEPGEPVMACYQCLRAGNASLGKDTVLGMVGWEEANAGITNGLPGLNHPDFDMIPLPNNENGWVQARVPKELLFELVRTPNYPTRDGEQWQFCCRRPMIYVGAWDQQDFEKHSPDGDAMAYFMAIVDHAHDRLWEGGKLAPIPTYVFRCPECGNHKAHWDVD